jgi:dihydrolipoamide dehydrogenase
MQVTLIEADPRLGGSCLLRGCIPSKALLHVAKVLDEAKDMSHWGVQFERLAIDLDAMRARKNKVIDTLSGGLKHLAGRRKVQVIHARASFEDSQTLRLDRLDTPGKTERLTYEHCILASGSRPMKISAFDINSPRVMDSTSALELPDIPENLLVIGGGYIGLEMGTVYAQLGTKVTVVELTAGLLPGADRDLVKPLQQRIEKIFAGVLLSTKVVRLTDKKDAIEVTLQDADGSDSVACWCPSAGDPTATASAWRTRRSRSINAASLSPTNDK